ncbi:MAG TPA: leucyl/phenylalanyl-tRNA--protein transferase [Thermoanaerobaculia bacterium]|nr:leucyl/phenylalanyl-tRNA--protein transferase [Thermoanaerobaculia bacterium]
MTTASVFPDPRRARGDVVALGDDLRPDTILDAYRHGIFPWPAEGMILPWFSPKRRAVLDYDRLHVSRSLKRARRSTAFTFTIDRAFPAVIRACAEASRPDQDGTWIFPEVIEAYTELHRLGHAHSIEVWEDDLLVGGIYGVDAGGAFGGESMFYRRPDASKLALLHLMDHLHERGLDWFDIQVMTLHMESLGARLISRSAFLDRLEKAQKVGRELFDRMSVQRK